MMALVMVMTKDDDDDDDGDDNADDAGVDATMLMMMLMVMMAMCRLKPAGGSRGPLRAGVLARGMPNTRPNPKPLYWREGSAVVGSSVTAGSRPPWAPRAWRVPGGWEGEVKPCHRPGGPGGTWPVPFDDKTWVRKWAKHAPPPPEGTLVWLRTERDVCGVLRALVLEWDVLPVTSSSARLSSLVLRAEGPPRVKRAPFTG